MVSQFASPVTRAAAARGHGLLRTSGKMPSLAQVHGMTLEAVGNLQASSERLAGLLLRTLPRA
jgi:hypothetical protein